MMSQDATEGDEWRVPSEVYGQLETAPPAARGAIVLGLIEAHPEARLLLPARDGVRAMLDGITLTRPAPEPRGESSPGRPRRTEGGRSGLDLRRADLRGASLQGADLIDVDLEGADLRETDLGRADLRGASLRLADLRGSRLFGANLAGANLAGADLRGAALEGADLRGTDLANARLEGANLGEADLRGAMLEEADLRGASVRFAKLDGAILEGANLRRADLRGAILQGADLKGADLRDAEFEEARLRGAGLSGADLRDCMLREADLRGADLTGADLRGAVLKGAVLREAVLREAKLQEVNLSHCDISHIHLGGAKLEKTSFLLQQLGGAIGEERARDFERAAQGYLALELNFSGLGDHDAASWAYCRRRRMQKREALGRARAARAGRRWWGEAVGLYAKYASDQLVEWICDYGESIPRVLGSLALVYAAFTLLYLVGGGVVRELELPAGAAQVPTRDPAGVAIFSLLVMTTGSPAGALQPRGDITLLLMGVQAFLGVALTGLLGFVLGNRIRR